MVNLTYRKQRQLLWVGNLILGASVLLAVYWLAIRPVPVQAPSPGKSQNVPGVSAGAANSKPLTAYSSVWQRDLRKPLFDEATTTAAVSAPKTRLNVTLMGTVVDPGYSYALLRSGSGQTKLVEIGQVIDGAELTEVNADTVTMKFGGETVTLQIQKQGGAR